MISIPMSFLVVSYSASLIAMALINEPDILIADEPTTALDVTVQAEVLLLIKEIQAKWDGYFIYHP